MTTLLSPSQFAPLLILPAFVALWIGAMAATAKFSGWRSLAERYASTRIADGESFRMVSGSVGRSSRFAVNYKNCLTLLVTRSGFGLSLFFPFNLFSPALFVPWSQVQSVTLRNAWFGRYVLVLIRDNPIQITLRGGATQSIQTAFGKFTSTYTA